MGTRRLSFTSTTTIENVLGTDPYVVKMTQQHFEGPNVSPTFLLTEKFGHARTSNHHVFHL